jgi:pimeloyl-ACP methyl ester carboxylesterase
MFFGLQSTLTSWLFNPTKLEISQSISPEWEPIPFDGAYYGWRLQRPRNDTNSVVYFMHGNSGCALEYFEFLNQTFPNLDVVCVEYPGFGWNGKKGRPTIEGCTEHVRKCFNNFVRKEYSRIHIVAYSIGTVIAARAFEYAIMENVKSFVLVSPIDDINQVVSDNTYIPGIFTNLILGTEPTMYFWNHVLQFMSRDTRTVIMIGSFDTVVKPERSLSLARALPGIHEVVFRSAGHAEILFFLTEDVVVKNWQT